MSRSQAAGGMRVLVVAVGLSLAGTCDSSSVASVFNQPPEQIRVVPEVVSLVPSGDTAFLAFGISVFDTVVVAPTWSAAAGTIDSLGRYTAPADSGTYYVVATLGNLRDSSTLTVSPIPVTTIAVSPSAVSVVPGDSVQFRAVGINASADTVPISVAWSASGGAISQAGIWIAPSVGGNHSITASNGALNGVATGTVTLAPSAGPPSPQPGDLLILDTRAGGAGSIQTATSLAGAQSASGLTAEERCRAGPCDGPGFSSNVDGQGLRAFVWNVKRYAANPAGCVPGGPSEHDWKLYRNMGGVTGTLFVQYRTWGGRTATGGTSAGSVGQFTHGSGHKDIVFFRAGGTNDGRLTVATTRGEVGGRFGTKFTFGSIVGDTASGTFDDLRSQLTGGFAGEGWIYSAVQGASFDMNTLLNQPVVHTWYLRPQSATGVKDGVVRAWVNDLQVLDLSGVGTGTLGWGELQIGGPTWECPSQDQTMYFWDIVVWSPV